MNISVKISQNVVQHIVIYFPLTFVYKITNFRRAGTTRTTVSGANAVGNKGKQGPWFFHIVILFPNLCLDCSKLHRLTKKDLT
jgi:hypothetical protein